MKLAEKEINLFSFTRKTAPLDILKGYRINPNGSATLDLIAAAKLPSFKKTVDSLKPLPKKDLNNER